MAGCCERGEGDVIQTLEDIKLIRRGKWGWPHVDDREYSNSPEFHNALEPTTCVFPRITHVHDSV